MNNTMNDADGAGRSRPRRGKSKNGVPSALDGGTGGAAASTGRTPAKVRELTVKAWEGPVDGRELNREILRIIREDDRRQGVTEAELSRRYHIRRQHLHNLHTEPDMTMTIPMTTHWCNARHVDVGYLIVLAGKSLRQRHARHTGHAGP